MPFEPWTFARRVEDADRVVMWPHDLATRSDMNESDLLGQFRLTDSPKSPPAGWHNDHVDSWYLACDERLPVMRLTNQREHVGWILGYPVTEEGDWLATDLEVGDGLAATADSVERLLNGFTGRFVAIIVGLDRPRVYLDALGSMGVVYSAEQRTVASSVFLIHYSGDPDDRVGFQRKEGVLRPPHLYFGLTVRTSVNWLLPNHYLDLSLWRPTRHWPKSDIAFDESGQEIREKVEFVAERVGRSVKAVVQAGQVRMSLTAGRDSRVLLACARDLISEIEFVTDIHGDRRGSTDLQVARRIAKIAGLRHHVIRRQSVTDFDLLKFLYRTGGVGAFDGRSQESLGAGPAADAAIPHVAGNGGEMNRTSAFAPSLDESKPLDTAGLLAVKGQPVWEEIVERGSRWFDELPVTHPYSIWDLRVLELHMGGWGGFVPYGHADMAKFIFMPFADRKAIEALMSLPVAYRKRSGVVEDIIRSRWPELLDIPFNEVDFGAIGWYRRARKYAKRALRR